MAEYKSRETLLKAVEKMDRLDKESTPYEYNKEGYILLIQKAPTADVAEVKWIDVNERLPEKNVRVLVYLKENACDYTRIDTDRRIDNGQWIRWGYNVTHWQPLPEPPSGAKMDGGKEE